MAKDTVEEQTQRAFAPKSAAELYRQQQTDAGLQKGKSYGDLAVEGVSTAVSGIKDEIKDKGVLGFAKNIATGAATGVVDEYEEFSEDRSKYVKDAIKDTAAELYTGTKNFFTKNEEDRLLEKFNVTLKDATDDQVTEIREETLSDALIAAGVIPGVGQAGKVAGKALYKATGPGGAFEYNPNQLNMLAGPRGKTSAKPERFDPEALKSAANQNDKSRKILVDMPIEDFLRVAEKVSPDDPGRADSRKITKELVEKGTPFRSIPSLTFENLGDGTAKATGHEGRHRAMALLAAGEDTIPVVLKSSGGKGGSIRWGQQSDPDSFDYIDVLPDRLKSEDTDDVVPMPDAARNIRKQASAENIRSLVQRPINK